MEIISVNPGPVVWLTGCVHGDEVGGIVVIQEIFKKLRREPLLKGSVHAFPLMNPIGFETASRHITLSREDLNRSFPGNKNGSLAERIADKIFTTIIETNPTLVLDLHNDWRKSIPYTFIDPPEVVSDKETYEKMKLFSKMTGFLIVSEQKEAYEREHMEKTISGSFNRHGIPSLTLELGESYVVNEENVEYGVKSILNILDYLGMVKPMSEKFTYQIPEFLREKVLRYSHRPLSAASGVVRFLIEPGNFVKKGQSVARVYNAFGKLRDTIRALQDGVVLGYSDSSVGFPGVPVIAFAVI
ncbi:MAG: succinylglutamate desuccinylase/aspartoacylase family protein [Candidatus Jordarchaeum sp.]|uniref:succinylglutamate desuccinylase/aspartoacylase family protein n=1 Tax=Candidatus Jordarchaeum sp. TaxID=2823881 RepID=UPI004048FE5E